MEHVIDLHLELAIHSQAIEENRSIHNLYCDKMHFMCIIL